MEILTLKAGVDDKPVFIYLQENWFSPKKILENNDCFCYGMKILEPPTRKWYQVFFQYISFGWYRAKWKYKVKLITVNGEPI